jgi:hypothetical protein
MYFDIVAKSDDCDLEPTLLRLGLLFQFFYHQISGTIQNINEQATVEISTSDTDNTGLILYPRQKFKWVDATIYARAGWGVEGVKVAII